MSTSNPASLCRQRIIALLVTMTVAAVLGCGRLAVRPDESPKHASTAAPAKPPAPPPDVVTTAPPPSTPHEARHPYRAAPPPVVASEPPPLPHGAKRSRHVERGIPEPAPPPPPPPQSTASDQAAETGGGGGPAGETAPPTKPDSNVVRVFYATDRQPSGTAQSPAYGPNEDPAGQMSYGVAAVSIPPDHRMGKLEEPILDIKLLYNPKKYVTILGIKNTDQPTFFSQLKTDVASSPRKEALIFIHGFNVSFPEALRRTAQLSYDLQFHGATICYSWPSRGSMFDYTADEDSVQWTALHLLNFLEAVYTTSGATSIDIVAHSMGNRALLSALQLIGSSPTPQFDEVVLAAPDVAASLFTQLIPTVQKHAQRITLYASSKDQALVASARVNHYHRAGDSSGVLTIIPPVETIDASTVDTGFLGHSYFGDSSSVISDLYYLLKDDYPASKRSRLEQKTIPAGIYWAFRP